MRELIEDMLTLAREGTHVTDVEPVALDGVTGRCWEAIVTAGATLVVETERTIRADASRVQQLLENLIRDAVVYGGSGVTVTAGDPEDGFHVSDDGPGIPEEERERCSRPATPHRGPGTGSVSPSSGRSPRDTDGTCG